MIAGTDIYASTAPWGPFTHIAYVDPERFTPPTFRPCSHYYGNYIVESMTRWDGETGIASLSIMVSVFGQTSDCDTYGVALMEVRPCFSGCLTRRLEVRGNTRLRQPSPTPTGHGPAASRSIENPA